MDYPVPAYTSFTIPTGATTGARITFNEFGDGVIRVYDINGNLSDTIGGNFGAIISYGFGINPSTEIQGGVIRMGDAPGFSPSATIKVPKTFLGSLLLDTGPSNGGAANPDGVQINMMAGADNQSVGSATAPFVQIQDDNADSAVKVFVGGSLIYQFLNGTAATWQAPSYSAGWQAGNSFQSLGGNGLQFRIDAEDNVVLEGLVNCAVGGNTTVFNLPAGYRPASRTPHFQVGYETGGVMSTREIAVTPGGVVFISGAPAAGDNISFSAKFPLGNLI